LLKRMKSKGAIILDGKGRSAVYRVNLNGWNRMQTDGASD
jgi:hypothetical protein